MHTTLKRHPAPVREASEPRWDFEEGEEIAPGRSALKRLGGGRRYDAYLAWDQRLHAVVVCKVVRPHLVADSHTLAGLAGEWAMLQRLAHPVIVRGFDAVLDGPRPHLVLEHLEGPRLSTLVRRYGPLPTEQLVPLALELAAAIHYLRTEGVVHLDIKPSNTIMGAPPRLIDLSVALAAQEAAALRSPVGTDAYMAPEQCDPERLGPVGPAADVWGLGRDAVQGGDRRAAVRRSRSRDAGDGRRDAGRSCGQDPRWPERAPDPLASLIMLCLERDPGAPPRAGRSPRTRWSRSSEGCRNHDSRGSSRGSRPGRDAGGQLDGRRSCSLSPPARCWSCPSSCAGPARRRSNRCGSSARRPQDRDREGRPRGPSAPGPRARPQAGPVPEHDRASGRRPGHGRARSRAGARRRPRPRRLRARPPTGRRRRTAGRDGGGGGGSGQPSPAGREPAGAAAGRRPPRRLRRRCRSTKMTTMTSASDDDSGGRRHLTMAPADAEDRDPQSGTPIGPEAEPERRPPLARRITGGVRARILASYVILLAIAAFASVLAVRQVLLVRLDDRVEEDLQQEVQEFRALAATGIDPRTRKPFGDDVEAIFRTYLERNVPDDDEELITVPRRGIPRRDGGDNTQSYSFGDFIERWRTLEEVERGEIDTPGGPARYVAIPVEGETGTLGHVRRRELHRRRARAGRRGGPDRRRGRRRSCCCWARCSPSRSPVGCWRRCASCATRLARYRGPRWTTGSRSRATTRSPSSRARSTGCSTGSRSRSPASGSSSATSATSCGRRSRSRAGTSSCSPRVISGRGGPPGGDRPGHRRARSHEPLRRRPAAAGEGREPRLPPARDGAARRAHRGAGRQGARDGGSPLADRLGLAALDRRRPPADHAGDHEPRPERGRPHRGRRRGRDRGGDRGDEASIWVRDTGTGIPISEQRRIFSRFSRGMHSRGRYEGTGIGLAIVRAIAEAHGGRVRVTSRPGGGRAVRDPAPRRAGGAGGGLGSGGGHMKRILIVEDEPGMASFIDKGLASRGYATKVCPDGATATAIASDSDFDLVILDLGLPDVDGLSVLREIRRRGERMPVIVLTARDDLTDKVEGLDAGASDYVTKPFKLEELLARARVQLRDERSAEPTVLEAGGITLDIRTRKAMARGTWST